MSQYKTVFDKNIERVEGLCSLYTMLKEANQSDGNDYRLTDCLRASIVFLHSSFEEYFRSVLIRWLPEKASEETLKQIPIALNAGKKPEKLFLNDLARYREKKVNEIISESVEEYLKLQSFNDQGNIRSWCLKIGIDLSAFGGLGDIDKAVHRRHKIVHEADTNRIEATNKERLQPVRPGDIIPWIKAYKDLVDLIDKTVSSWEGE